MPGKIILYWQQTDKNKLKIINELIKECSRTPYTGKGKRSVTLEIRILTSCTPEEVMQKSFEFYTAVFHESIIPNTGKIDSRALSRR